MMRKQKGFSLIELLIVVTIILVIAAVAIPNLLRSKMTANEVSAISSIRTIVTSEIIYSTTYAVGFSTDLPSLSDGGVSTNCIPPAIPAAASACLIDPALATGAKSGYLFTYAATGSGGVDSSYILHGNPLLDGYRRQRHFFTDATHVLRASVTEVASTAAP